MANIFIPILAFLLTNINIGVSRRLAIFTRRDDFAENTCIPPHIAFIIRNLDKTVCLRKCSLDSTCVSVVYSGKLESCVLCNSDSLDIDVLTYYDGAEFYSLTSKTYDEKCNAEDTCTGDNESCESEICTCGIGYNFNVSSQACE